MYVCVLDAHGPTGQPDLSLSLFLSLWSTMAQEAHGQGSHVAGSPLMAGCCYLVPIEVPPPLPCISPDLWSAGTKPALGGEGFALTVVSCLMVKTLW